MENLIGASPASQKLRSSGSGRRTASWKKRKSILRNALSKKNNSLPSDEILTLTAKSLSFRENKYRNSSVEDLENTLSVDQNNVLVKENAVPVKTAEMHQTEASQEQKTLAKCSNHVKDREIEEILKTPNNGEDYIPSIADIYRQGKLLEEANTSYVPSKPPLDPCLITEGFIRLSQFSYSPELTKEIPPDTMDLNQTELMQICKVADKAMDQSTSTPLRWNNELKRSSYDLPCTSEIILEESPPKKVPRVELFPIADRKLENMYDSDSGGSEISGLSVQDDKPIDFVAEELDLSRNSILSQNIQDLSGLFLNKRLPNETKNVSNDLTDIQSVVEQCFEDSYTESVSTVPENSKFNSKLDDEEFFVFADEASNAEDSNGGSVHGYMLSEDMTNQDEVPMDELSDCESEKFLSSSGVVVVECRSQGAAGVKSLNEVLDDYSKSSDETEFLGFPDFTNNNDALDKANECIIAPSENTKDLWGDEDVFESIRTSILEEELNVVDINRKSSFNIKEEVTNFEVTRNLSAPIVLYVNKKEAVEGSSQHAHKTDAKTDDRRIPETESDSHEANRSYSSYDSRIKANDVKTFRHQQDINFPPSIVEDVENSFEESDYVERPKLNNNIDSRKKSDANQREENWFKISEDRKAQCRQPLIDLGNSFSPLKVGSSKAKDPFIGFKSASGAAIQISEKVLEKAKSLFSDIDHEMNDLSPVRITKSFFDSSKLITNGKKSVETHANLEPMDLANCNANQFGGGFTSASGKPLKIIEEAAERAKRLFSDIDENLESLHVQSFKPGYKEYSCKRIKISENALVKANEIFNNVGRIDYEVKENLSTPDQQKHRPVKNLTSMSKKFKPPRRIADEETFVTPKKTTAVATLSTPFNTPNLQDFFNSVATSTPDLRGFSIENNLSLSQEISASTAALMEDEFTCDLVKTQWDENTSNEVAATSTNNTSSQNLRTSSPCCSKNLSRNGSRLGPTVQTRIERLQVYGTSSPVTPLMIQNYPRKLRRNFKVPTRISDKIQDGDND